MALAGGNVDVLVSTATVDTDEAASADCASSNRAVLRDDWPEDVSSGFSVLIVVITEASVCFPGTSIGGGSIHRCF